MQKLKSPSRYDQTLLERASYAFVHKGCSVHFAVPSELQELFIREVDT